MNIRPLPNGNLEMTADCNEQRDIIAILEQEKIISMAVLEAAFIINVLGGDPMGDGISYTQVTAEEVGALTCAPLISDGDNIYGYMDYQITNFLEELSQGKPIVWIKS